MTRLLAALALLCAAATGPAGAGMALLMFEAPGCSWCARWNEEIGGSYARTEAGRRAPLERLRISAALPEDVTLSSRARYTPTFVLIEDGREVGRIEGYPGADFFYPMLERLIARADAPER